MNRFGRKRNFLHIIFKFRLSYFIFVALFVLFIYGLLSVSNTTTNKQEESLRNALNRNIIHCYCTEGTYPPSLSYLEEHYGLTYDKDTFYIEYIAYGSNILPEVTIMRK